MTHRVRASHYDALHRQNVALKERIRYLEDTLSFIIDDAERLEGGEIIATIARYARTPEGDDQ